jgi:peptide/nickel transport system permease protein
VTYLLRRVGFYAIAWWVSLTLNFFIPRLAPGDPAAALEAQFQGRLDPAAFAAMRAAFGLTDEPVWVQYVHYLRNLTRGDLGVSIAHFPARVADVLEQGLLWTLFLSGLALLVSFSFGTLLGIYIGFYRGRRADTLLPSIFTFLGAFPYFWLAMVMLYFGGFLLGWFPLRHAYSDAARPAWSLSFAFDVAHHAILPASAIVLASLGGWLITMRSSMMSVLGEDYILLARAKGLGPRGVMLRYAARNAILPSITGFGMALGFILSGSLLTEVVFSYPGQGYLFFEAVKSLDYPLMQGLFLSITTSVLLANFCVDLVVVALDPRVRGQNAGS